MIWKSDDVSSCRLFMACLWPQCSCEAMRVIENHASWEDRKCHWATKNHPQAPRMPLTDCCWTKGCARSITFEPIRRRVQCVLLTVSPRECGCSLGSTGCRTVSMYVHNASVAGQRPDDSKKGCHRIDETTAEKWQCLKNGLRCPTKTLMFLFSH